MGGSENNSQLTNSIFILTRQASRHAADFRQLRIQNFKLSIET